MEDLHQQMAEAEALLNSRLSLFSRLATFGSDADAETAKRVAMRQAREALRRYLALANRLGLDGKA